MSDPQAPEDISQGMSARTAATVEFSIIGLCVMALVFVFQPFSQTLFTAGSILVIVGGLSFNLVPLCRPGVPGRSVARAALIVVTILVVVVVLAICAAMLYGVYLRSQ